MRKQLFLFGFLFSIACFSQPKLVVGIVVDQMRYEYIDRYWNKFGDNGFKRLIKEGYSCKNTTYNYVPTITGPGHASIYTGATPSVHGIVSNDWLDRNKNINIYCAQDDSVSSVGTTNRAGQMSPRNLMMNTITDELKKATNNQAKVIGISLKDRGAILPVGKYATAAYWYDGATGRFISSTYYMKQLPGWVNDFNDKELPRKYLSQIWTTALPIETYTESDPDDSNCERPFRGKEKPIFPYDLFSLKNTNGGLDILSTTPFGNTFIKEFAMTTLINEKMGKDAVPDFLAISFSSTDYIGHQFGPQSIEVEDCYIRLDKELGELMDFLDRQVGKNEYLLFLTSDHGASDAYPCLLKKNIPTGVLKEENIADSLRKFFVKTYQNSFLLAVKGFDIYLNREAIAKKKFKLEEVQSKTSNYLMSLKGISCSLTEKQMAREVFQDSVRSKIKLGYNHKRSGDIIYALKPHWLLGYTLGTTHGSPYSYDTHVPLIFFGWNIHQGMSEIPVKTTDIVPTISHLLNIPPPKGTMGVAIKGIQ